jgi:transcriptional regulator with XRE-family HTH domain
MASDHQRKAGYKRSFAPGEKEALVKRATEMKRQGRNRDEAAVELGISVTSYKRWTKGTKAVRKTPTKKNVRDMNKQRRLELENDREKNKIDSSQNIEGDRRVLYMPRDPSAFNTRGPSIDPSLVIHAARVLDTWVTDKGKGRLTTVAPLDINKAAYVVASNFTIWDYSNLQTDRQSWRTVRTFTGRTAEDIANVVGVSFASISRWEKAERNPDAQYHRRLHEVYKDMLDQKLLKLEWSLILRSYIETLPEDHDPEAVIDKDDIVWWAVTDSDSLQAIDITHIKHLYQMRQLMPRPTWREPSAWNLGLNGYGNQLVTA